MYTQCLECLTIYRIPVDALTRAHGRARCGVCRAEFDALATLVDHLPAEPVSTLERHQPGPLPILDVPAMRPKAGQHDLFAPDLPAYVAAARAAGITNVRVQTNATTLGHGPLLGRLLAAGGMSLVSVQQPGALTIFDTAQFQERRRFLAHTGVVMGVAFGPDGTSVLSCSEFEPGIKVWAVP